MLKPNTILPGLEVPNLDSLTDEDLDNACDAFDAFDALLKLAYFIRAARQYRLQGWIQDAIDTERNCDMRYASLPQSMRYRA